MRNSESTSCMEISKCFLDMDNLKHLCENASTIDLI